MSNKIFSLTLNHGNEEGFDGMNIFFFELFSILPDERFSRPAIILTNDDFPAPVGARIVANSPSPILKLIFSSR